MEEKLEEIDKKDEERVDALLAARPVEAEQGVYDYADDDEEEVESKGNPWFPGAPIIMGFLSEFKRWIVGIAIFVILFFFLLGFLFGWMVFA